MSQRSKKPRPDGHVPWISVNFGILLLLSLIVLAGWALWYLPRDRSTSIEYTIADPPQRDRPAEPPVRASHSEGK